MKPIFTIELESLPDFLRRLPEPTREEARERLRAVENAIALMREWELPVPGGLLRECELWQAESLTRRNPSR